MNIQCYILIFQSFLNLLIGITMSLLYKKVYIVDHTCMISFKHLSSRQPDNQVCQQQPRGSGRSFCVGSREEGAEQLH